MAGLLLLLGAFVFGWGCYQLGAARERARGHAQRMADFRDMTATYVLDLDRLTAEVAQLRAASETAITAAWHAGRVQGAADHAMPALLGDRAALALHAYQRRS